MNMNENTRKNFEIWFGIRLPIVAGGLMWLSNVEYVAAAVNAEILGFITAASFPDDNDLRKEIRKCRDLAGENPFGVNVSIWANPINEEVLNGREQTH